VHTLKPKPGRARRYDIHPVLGFADPDIAYVVAMLDELSERLFDLLSDLPLDTLDHVPEGTTNSIAMLVLHIAWGEADWISRATGYPIAAELQECLLPGRQDASGDLPVSSTPASELIGYCRTVRQTVTRLALASVDDIDRELDTTGALETVRQVLMHLVWHWVYHSGQVGLLRRLGSDKRYRWTFQPGESGDSGSSR
jgi:uncharacterized damage-inducible protein DinB